MAMRRRSFLASGAAAAVTAAAGGCARESNPGAAPAGAAGNKPVRWRLASSFPHSLDTIFGSAEGLARRVREMSGGAFDITVHQAGEIVPAMGVLDAVQDGTVEVAHSAGYYFSGVSSALVFDTCVPFGMDARQTNAWLAEGGGRALVDELYAELGLVSFPAGNTGAQMGGWFRREVSSAADLKGLKMRIPGLGGDVMAALGASVQLLPGAEIFPALERGAIDATEWVGPYDDEKLGFHKIAKYYTYPGWWEPGPSLSFMVSRAAWEALPGAYREMFKAAASAAAATMQARYDALNPPALERLLASGVELRPFSTEILTQARTATKDLLAAKCAADPRFARIHAEWDKARRAAFGWFRTAELAYASFAFPAVD